jgi:hypothetical protein
VGRRWAWVVWSILAVYIVSVVVATILGVANGTFQPDAAEQIMLDLGFSAFIVVGALIVAYRPGNAIGWIFSATGLLAATSKMAVEYAAYGYVTRSGSLPGAVLAAWYQSWAWLVSLALLLVFTPLLFPTGRLLSRRWRPVAWLAGTATAALVVLVALDPKLDMAPGHVIANPIGVAAVGNPDDSPVVSALLLVLVLLAVLAVGSLVLRFRRSRGVERQQLKWFTYAGAILVPLEVLVNFLPATAPSLVFAVMGGVPLVFVPVAAGLAILRYRLYDIDRLINRTLVNGLLTALLASVYAGAVLVLGQAFGGVGKDRPVGWWPAPP